MQRVPCRLTSHYCGTGCKSWRPTADDIEMDEKSAASHIFPRLGYGGYGCQYGCHSTEAQVAAAKCELPKDAVLQLEVPQVRACFGTFWDHVGRNIDRVRN